MKKILSIISIIITVGFCGCSKNLSEEVFSDLTEKGYNYKSEEVYNIIGSVYAHMRGWHSLWGYSGLQEFTTDALVQPANASGWSDGGTYLRLHQHSWNAEQGHLADLWSFGYRGVLLSNRIIEQLAAESIPVPPNVSRESLIAEITVVRALYYWLLIDNFGDVPFITASTQELPVKTERATIYTNIVSDINNAIEHLSPENNIQMYGRINKWSAKALLANLYLNAKEYNGTAELDKCIAECNDIISSGKYSLEPNFADCFDADNENSRETILAAPCDEINGGSMFINATLHTSSKDKYDLRTGMYGASSVKAVSQFIDTWDPEDARYNATWENGLQYASDGVTPLLCVYEKTGQQLNYSKDLPNGIYTGEDEGFRIIKYKPEMGASNPMNNDVIIFRYAQVLMMKAECLLRKGQADEAADLVTQVRQRAFKNNPGKAQVTGAQLTGDSKYKYGYVEDYKIVDQGDTSPVEFGGFYDELGYEFVYEFTRRRDMIRFGTYTTKSWLSHKPNGNYRKIFPIPQSALDANPNLIQNQGY
ncbi:MAG TPA: RagB/SusD family nutrient uptake outer membrane protein [Niabella sp.]|uniref:RagB/SusD family nutrient uptake outer membrane protein n=1 Tax=Agriterribacter sp. TaxID=2821509 RepID=UPI002C8E336E|nr:RagB/SusD family nutrient uptake outer membrane protein [Agriterribacter sp.]HRO85869.1 RagB/SusD family nutrient uptake outer membrane protein [Niabella sp.]HRP56246.1 RagB/SusD family nutrient uptake outer membrane protein [Agriterribacter sp.]